MSGRLLFALVNCRRDCFAFAVCLFVFSCGASVGLAAEAAGGSDDARVAERSNHSGGDHVTGLEALAPAKQEGKVVSSANLKQRGVHHIWDGFAYVSPVYVQDLRQYKNRINLFAVVQAGAGIVIGGHGFGTHVFAPMGAGFGVEMIFGHFYFGAGVQAYGMMGEHTQSGYQGLFGYKFQLMLGAYITPLNGPDMKLYFLYRDNQLQVAANLSPEFGYFSRNVGLGLAVRVVGPLELGVEVFFSLMHSDTTYEHSGDYDYPFVSPQFFAKLSF